MIEKTCCVTGHRKIPFDKINDVKERLRQEVEQAIEDGFNCFISGFAEGVDLYFAEIVAEQKRNGRWIQMEAAVPYRNRYYRLMTDIRTRYLMDACERVKVVSETYQADVFSKRNQYMVDQSSRVIAVYDGRGTGGTAATVRYAKKRGREIREIAI